MMNLQKVEEPKAESEGCAYLATKYRLPTIRITVMIRVTARRKGSTKAILI